jgi:5-methylcytosine-specific restriction protein A
MPVASPRPCKYSGCSALVSTAPPAPSYCPTHSASKDPARYNRGTTASKGYGSDWERIRLVALERDKYLCQMCLSDSIATPATLVDHVVPVKVDRSRRLDLTNLQSLCVTCHSIKTYRDKFIPRPSQQSTKQRRQSHQSTNPTSPDSLGALRSTPGVHTDDQSLLATPEHC